MTKWLATPKWLASLYATDRGWRFASGGKRGTGNFKWKMSHCMLISLSLLCLSNVITVNMFKEDHHFHLGTDTDSLHSYRKASLLSGNQLNLDFSWRSAKIWKCKKEYKKFSLMHTFMSNSATVCVDERWRPAGTWMKKGRDRAIELYSIAFT